MSKTFLNHEEPFSGIEINLDEEIPETAKSAKLPSAAIATGSQIVLASIAWTAATNGSAAIIDSKKGILNGLKAVRPSMVLGGVLPMLLYNSGPVEVAIAAQKKVLGEEKNSSALRASAAVLAGASMEAAIGNPLDFLSVHQILTSVKTADYLEKNPQSILKFSEEELRKLMPKASAAANKEELIQLAKDNHYKNISFTPKNLAIISKNLGVKLTVGDVAKSIAVMFPTSVVRNFPFYIGLLEANKPKDDPNSSITETMIISLVGALSTTIPNNATYTAAINVAKGQGELQAFTGALKESATQAWREPQKFAALIGIRSMATFAAICCFSDYTRDSLSGVIDGISNVVSKSFGLEGALTDEEKKALDDQHLKGLSNHETQKSLLEKLKTPENSPNTTEVGKLSADQNKGKGK